METQRPNQAGAEPAGSPDPEAQPGDPARIVALVTPSSGVVVDALRRLGPDVQLLVAHDDVPARSLLASGDVDLLVVDQGATADWLPLLEDVRAKGGPPALVLCREGGDSTALAAFRAGASDCLAPGPALAETLPVAALEAIRRGRAVRAALRADHLERHVDSLERTTRNIVQNMSGALLVLDPQGRISWTNRRAEELLGVELDGLEGQPAADWFPGVPRAELFSARTLREGVRFRDVETMLTRAGGDVVPVSLSCSPLVRDDGSRSGAVLVLQDLSELKQLQRQVLQNEKMASIGQLAAGVAHEINNPMGFIHANLCQLSEYLDDLGKVWERTKALRQAAAGSGVAEPVAAAARELEASIAEVDAEFLITDFGKAIGESLEGSERIRHIVQDLRAFSHQDTAERVLADVNKALDSTANIVWTHDEALGRADEALRGAPADPVLPDATQAGVHEPARQRVSSDRGARR